MTAHPAGKNVLLFTRPAVEADAAPFAAAMREQDRAEFTALGEPAELLAGGIANSQWSYVAEDDGGYVAIWGVACAGTLLGGSGHVWCATTPRVLLHKRAFLLGSRAWLAAMQAEFETLAGWCVADYALSLRWLERWLGFSLAGIELLGGVPFVRFWWRKGTR